MRITEEEFAQRREAFAAALQERGLTGAVLFDPQYVFYYSGFFTAAPASATGRTSRTWSRTG